MAEGIKDVAHVFRTQERAYCEMKEWIYEHEEEILKVDKVKMCVTCRNGYKHHFMGYFSYDSWCMGRTYLMDGGDVFRSGYFLCKGGD